MLAPGQTALHRAPRSLITCPFRFAHVPERVLPLVYAGSQSPVARLLATCCAEISTATARTADTATELTLRWSWSRRMVSGHASAEWRLMERRLTRCSAKLPHPPRKVGTALADRGSWHGNGQRAGRTPLGLWWVGEVWARYGYCSAGVGVVLMLLAVLCRAWYRSTLGAFA